VPVENFRLYIKLPPEQILTNLVGIARARVALKEGRDEEEMEARTSSLQVDTVESSTEAGPGERQLGVPAQGTTVQRQGQHSGPSATSG
jgi:hypothetical protein